MKSFHQASRLMILGLCLSSGLAVADSSDVKVHIQSQVLPDQVAEELDQWLNSSDFSASLSETAKVVQDVAALPEVSAEDAAALKETADELNCQAATQGAPRCARDSSNEKPSKPSKLSWLWRGPWYVADKTWDGMKWTGKKAKKETRDSYGWMKSTVAKSRLKQGGLNVLAGTFFVLNNTSRVFFMPANATRGYVSGILMHQTPDKKTRFKVWKDIPESVAGAVVQGLLWDLVDPAGYVWGPAVAGVVTDGVTQFYICGDQTEKNRLGSITPGFCKLDDKTNEWLVGKPSQVAHKGGSETRQAFTWTRHKTWNATKATGNGLKKVGKGTVNAMDSVGNAVIGIFH